MKFILCQKKLHLVNHKLTIIFTLFCIFASAIFLTINISPWLASFRIYLQIYFYFFAIEFFSFYFSQFFLTYFHSTRLLINLFFYNIFKSHISSKVLEFFKFSSDRIDLTQQTEYHRKILFYCNQIFIPSSTYNTYFFFFCKPTSVENTFHLIFQRLTHHFVSKREKFSNFPLCIRKRETPNEKM